MPMTKKEKAQMEELKWQVRAEQNNVRIAKALGWSSHAEPSMISPPNSGRTFGWRVNSGAGRVEKAWSGPNTHGSGWVEGKDQGSSFACQGSIFLYASAQDAAIAFRKTLEERYAKDLASCDEVIGSEEPDIDSIQITLYR